jgi:V/A-type H+-transporting ATPase subunit I
MYVPREQTVYALEALGGTGKVELERDYVARPLLDTHVLRERVNRAKQLMERYARLLPAQGEFKPVVVTDPEAQALSALKTLRDTLSGRLRLERRQLELDRRLHRLDLLRRFLGAMGKAADEIAQISEKDAFICHAVFACPVHAAIPGEDEAPGTIRQFTDAQYRFCVPFCLREDRADYERRFRAAQCEPVQIPAWLRTEWPNRHARIQQEIVRLQSDEKQARHAIAQQQDDEELIEALNVISVLDWFLERTVTLGEDHRHCYITGWTTAADPAELQHTLDGADIDAKVIFRPMSPGHHPPIDLANGTLTGAFRQFVGMFGALEPGEIDPTPIIAFLYPAIFGFMFADVGHGLALIAASLLFRKTFPQVQFLLYCGLGATGFGLVFGEAFGLHLPWQPLAPCPMDNPLIILLGSMAFGALVLLLGLALSSIKAAWHGQLRKWMWQDGAVLVGYISCLAALFHPFALAIALLAFAWYVLGLILTGEKMAPGLGRLARSTLELSLNTLSFARIGAFAIAHTALTHTVTDLATAVDGQANTIAVFLIGHALIISLEGLVVFVQTTRLILFEFFTRFLHANGRIFRPLRPKGFPA